MLSMTMSINEYDDMALVLKVVVRRSLIAGPRNGIFQIHNFTNVIAKIYNLYEFIIMNLYKYYFTRIS